MNLELNNKFYSEATNKTTLVVVSTNPFLSFTAYLDNDMTSLDDNSLIEKAKEWLFKLMFVDKALPETIDKVDKIDIQIKELESLIEKSNKVISELENKSNVVSKVIFDNLEDKNIIDRFETGKTYKVGDLVIYNDVVYICKKNNISDYENIPLNDPENWEAYSKENKISKEEISEYIKNISAAKSWNRDESFERGVYVIWYGKLYKSTEKITDNAEPGRDERWEKIEKE